MSILSGTVLLTGASGGIGQAIARAVAPVSSNLILSGRREEVLEPLAAELGARVIACDLSRREQVERLAEEAAPVDMLIANAGVPAGRLLVEFTQGQVDQILEVNLRAPIALARAAPGQRTDRAADRRRATREPVVGRLETVCL